jgi:gamma-glutamyl-gamma-aminobutyrate hydrolase PuuD
MAPGRIAGLTHGPRTKIEPFAAALEALGLEVRPLNPDRPRIRMDDLHGLVLAGGTDINPALYGQTRRPDTESNLDVNQDQIELDLLEDALRCDLPVLAIRRGMQMLNVRPGGALIQHIQKYRFPGTTPEDLALPRHDVQLLEPSRLARMPGAAKLHVNSRHHQAVDRPGPSLHVVGWCEDGTPEAAERTERRFVVGGQWRPENRIDTNPRDRRLVEAFARAVAGEDLH